MEEAKVPEGQTVKEPTQEEMLDTAETVFYGSMKTVKAASKHPNISKKGTIRAFLMAINSGITNYNTSFINKFEKQLAIEMKNMIDSAIPLRAFILEEHLKEQEEMIKNKQEQNDKENIDERK